MPPINHAVIASAGAIALTVAVAAAIAVYESPELQRRANDIRRRIAIALHSLGEGVQPPSREPIFNRPEDAHGFMRPRAMATDEMGVDADEETRRRQREELMYWNSMLEEKRSGQKTADETSPRAPSRSTTFDDFLRQDADAEQGAYVFNTGAQMHEADEGLLRRRGGVEGVKGLDASVYENPFTDEHRVDDTHDLATVQPQPQPPSPGQAEMLSYDIYNATESADSQTLPPQSTTEASQVISGFGDGQSVDAGPEARPLVERELAQDEYMTAGQDDRDDAYASIQAWAQGSNPSFYSPLPVSPPAPLSEPELVSEGFLTPIDSASLAGSGEDIGNDAASSRAGESGRPYDVISESDDGILTPASWSEVGSVVSENESAVRG